MQLVAKSFLSGGCALFTCRPTQNKSIPFKVFRRWFAVKSQRVFPPPTGKICEKCSAVGDIKDGARILVGGYGLCGLPNYLLNGLVRTEVKRLTIIIADAGNEHTALGTLIRHNQVEHIITSAMSHNNLLIEKFVKGEIVMEIYPQGTLAECIRAGGAGIPAFYTTVGAGTLVQDGGIPYKYTRDGEVELASGGRPYDIINGRECIREDAILADYAFVKAWRGDSAGNLVFRKAARNFNSIMCKAATVTIAEIEEIVPLGSIPPDSVHVPGLYIDRVVHTKKKAMKVEHLRLQPTAHELSMEAMHLPDFFDRERIVRRAVLELQPGMCVSLSPGLPQKVVNFIPGDLDVRLHSLSGVIGTGPYPAALDKVDHDLVNSSMETVTELQGAAYMGSDECYAMIRGGHIDLVIVGAMEVSQYGDIANWANPDPANIAVKGGRFKGIGGAMDLVTANVNNTRVVVAMKHSTPEKQPKIVSACTWHVSCKQCVDLIITEKAVFTVDPERGLTLIEIADGISIEDVAMNTECTFEAAEEVISMRQCPIINQSPPRCDEQITRL